MPKLNRQYIASRFSYAQPTLNELSHHLKHEQDVKLFRRSKLGSALNKKILNLRQGNITLATAVIGGAHAINLSQMYSLMSKNFQQCQVPVPFNRAADATRGYMLSLLFPSKLIRGAIDVYVS